MLRAFERSAGALIASVALLLGGMLAATPAQAVTVDAGVAAVGEVVDTAAPASAAVYICNERGTHGNYPVHYSAPDAGQACYQNTVNYTIAATKAIQRSYNACYSYANVVVDGIYGSDTKEAVRNIQRYHGLAVDGLFGPSTASRFIHRLDWGTCQHWTP